MKILEDQPHLGVTQLDLPRESATTSSVRTKDQAAQDLDPGSGRQGDIEELVELHLDIISSI
jgi:hypothetical protein